MTMNINKYVEILKKQHDAIERSLKEDLRRNGFNRSKNTLEEANTRITEQQRMLNVGIELLKGIKDLTQKANTLDELSHRSAS